MRNVFILNYTIRQWPDELRFPFTCMSPGRSPSNQVVFSACQLGNVIIPSPEKRTCPLPWVAQTPPSTIRQKDLLFCNYAKLCTQAENYDTVQDCAALSPHESSLLVMTEMSALYQEESYRMSCTHSCTQSDTFSLSPPIMNMDIFHIFHKWGGFVSCSQPQAGSALTCRCACHFLIFHIVAFVLHFLLSPISCFFFLCHLQSWQSQSWSVSV